jgi:hypothetical protein
MGSRIKFRTPDIQPAAACTTVHSDGANSSFTNALDAALGVGELKPGSFLEAPCYSLVRFAVTKPWLHSLGWS